MVSNKKSYSEDVTDEERENWEAIFTNGVNSYLTTFENYVRPIKCDVTDLHKYNKSDINNHFIFGWFESFTQSDNVPQWMLEAENLVIEVVHED